MTVATLKMAVSPSAQKNMKVVEPISAACAAVRISPAADLWYSALFQCARCNDDNRQRLTYGTQLCPSTYHCEPAFSRHLAAFALGHCGLLRALS